MILPTLNYEQSFWDKGYKLVCGLDEVGRGCFAGPVVVGAVVFAPDIVLPSGIADSKLLSSSKREKLTEIIQEQAFDFALGEVSVEIINEIGIGKATQLAFRKAVESLKTYPDICLIDAFYIPGIEKDKQQAIKEGDSICASISAASIIAKVYRDGVMDKLHQDYPSYGWDKNKGYGTLEHRQAIKKHGLCGVHRKSFNLSKFL